MAALIVGFFGMLTISFTLIVLTTRKSKLEKSLDRRLDTISTARNNTVVSSATATELLKATTKSNFLWVDSLLEGRKVSDKIEELILQADQKSTVSKFVVQTALLFIVGTVVSYSFLRVPLVDIAIGLVFGCFPLAVLCFKRAARIKAFNAVLAETIDMLARALRAGYSMVGAIEMLSENAPEPAASEFREVFRQQNLGLPLRDALLQLMDRMPSLDLRVLVTAILVQKDTGGNLAEILDRTVFVIRERLRIQGEIRVHTAQGRLTGWILGCLPVVMLVLVNLINPGYSNILLDSPVGRKVIYAGVGLLIVGMFTIQRIINGIEV